MLVGTFKIRPDMWVVQVDEVPIGVVEVTEPDNRVVGMDHPNSLGELYDSMSPLPNFYGVSPAFGTFTNLQEWRVAWLPGDGVDEIASRVKDNSEDADGDDKDEGETYEEEEEDQVEQQTASKMHPIVHRIEDVDDDDLTEATEVAADISDRVLHVSKVYRYTDSNSEALRALLSAVYKSCRFAEIHGFNNPFENLENRTLLCIQKDKRTAIWSRLSGVVPNWNRVAQSSTTRLFALEDFGTGAVRSCQVASACRRLFKRTFRRQRPGS